MQQAAIEDVKCTGDSKGLEITYRSGGTTPSLIGPIFGRTSDYTTDRPATAELRVPDGLGVRPYLLCSYQIPSTIPSAVFKVDLPDSASVAAAACGAPPGNWWTINCPEDSSSSNAEMANNTANGCDDPIGIVPGQGTKTGAALRTHLVASCPPLSLSCLEGNTGNVRSNEVLAAWKSLVDKQETIILPVFCGKTRCDQPAYTGTGSTARYPVQSLVAVKVCGYHWGAGGSPSNPQNYPATLTGDCASAHTSRDVPGNDNFLLLKATRLQVSGKSDDSECAVGDPLCDKGLRKVELTK